MNPGRKHWLDWQRGVAVLFMVEVHVLDAWLAKGAGQGFAYDALRMLGGMAAPGFLYMAGLSQGLADAAGAAKGVAPEVRRRAALGRGLWLLGFAYAFRLVEFLVGGAWLRADGWLDVLRVDVLNVIAVGLLLGAWLAVGRSGGALRAGAAALAIVLATPVVAGALAGFDLARGGGAPAAVAPNRLADVLLAYAYGSWPRANFHLFNWAAFLLAGAAAAPLARGGKRPLAFLGVGAAAFALGLALDAGPDVYAHQSFWRTSPAWFAMRLGVCLALTGALQLLPDAAGKGLSWLSLLGRQSLAGYVASVELTYGALAHPLRQAISFEATIAGMVAMVAVTWAISLGWERFGAWRKARGRGAGGPAASPA